MSERLSAVVSAQWIVVSEKQWRVAGKRRLLFDFVGRKMSEPARYLSAEHRNESVRNVAICPDALHRSVPGSLRDRDGQLRPAVQKQAYLPFSLERR